MSRCSCSLTKEDEGVAWRGIRNQSFQLTELCRVIMRIIHHLQVVAIHHINASRVREIWEVGIVSHHSNVFRAIPIGVWGEDGCRWEGSKPGA